MDLLLILEELGIEGIRDGGKEITAMCPVHEARTGHKDRHPSWSINRETGAHICFSCGWSGGLNALYVDLGHPLPDDLEQQLRVDALKGKANKVLESKQTGDVEEETIEEQWSEQRLRVLDPVPSRMADIRRLDVQALYKFGVLWDPTQRCWVLPIRDEYGELLGVQLRQKGTELNQPKGMEKSGTLFGLHLHQHVRINTITLVESPLDAVRLDGLGIPAVASFGAWVSLEQVDLLSRHFLTVVLALDNDAPGQHATDRVEQLLREKRTFTVRFRYGRTRAKDPGDYESDEQLTYAWKQSFQRR
jgi:DNA primase